MSEQIKEWLSQGKKKIFRVLERGVFRWKLSAGIYLLLLLLASATVNAQAIYPLIPEQNSTESEQEESPVLQKDQLRQLLLELLQPEADQEKDTIQNADAYGSAFSTFVKRQTRTEAVRQELMLFFKQINLVSDAVPGIPGQIEKIYSDVAKSLGDFALVKAIAMFGSIVLVWLGTQLTIGKRLRKYPNKLQASQTEGVLSRLKYTFVMFFLEFVIVLAYIVLSAGIPFFLVPQDSSAQVLLLSFWTSSIEFSFWLGLLYLLFAPQAENIRLMAVPDAEAKSDFYLLAAFFLIFELGFGLAQIFRNFEAKQSIIFVLFFTSLFLNSLLVARQWRHINTLRSIFPGSASGNNVGVLIGNLWPLLFTFWLTAVWIAWLYNTIMENEQGAYYAAFSWWITLFFPYIDRMVYLLLEAVTNLINIESSGFNQRARRFVNTLLYSARFILVGVALYMLVRSLGISFSNITDMRVEGNFVDIAIDVVGVLVISYIVWEVLHTYLESKIPETNNDALAQLEGDGGGAGASRSETLLPLVRSFLSVVLLIFIILAVLNALGVRVAPLLAGAGIIGIAIGFGAQKLVQDILSGLFFLIDDAFRRGEYIEIEDLRGTVEKISLRSMQLRHHLGAVQTIPYGEIKTVKNLSRDWVTVKLEIRLPYTTNIEKVRKIIKKTGLKMLEDPVLGPNFLLPLKSQGVSRVEESALMIRMKFTAKPGEQWVIRREAFRRVQEALADNGIEFAHREVHVRLPAEVEQQLTNQNSSSTADAVRNILPHVSAAAAASMEVDNPDGQEGGNPLEDR